MSATKTPRIIVIDDDPRLRHLIATILRLDFDEVQVFGDASSAWMEARSQRVGLLITDARLKTVSGVQLAESLRSTWRSLRPIFMTEDRVLANKLSIEYGQNAVLQKPFTAAELRNCAMQALSGKRP